MLDDDKDLHRLVWSPDEIEGGKVKTTAFRRSDLGGGVGFVSVSRVDIIEPSAEIAIAERQASRADGVQFQRDEAWSALLNCGAVKRKVDTDGFHPFSVTAEPIPGENEAHCGIRNTSGKCGNGYINQLRVLLVEAVHEARTFDQFLASIGSSRFPR